MKKIITHLQNSDTRKLILRLTLGFVFFISGYKIAFPSDAAALAASYMNPDKGWISPFFTDWINNTLGLDIATYLMHQGFLEMLMGTALIFGALTTLTAIGMGLLYWAFTVANPIAGEIRLSRDLALMAMVFGLAYYGPGKYSIDNSIRVFMRSGKEEVLSFAIRFGVGFTFAVSALFSSGVMSNSLNSTIPVAIVFVLGILLMANVQIKHVAILSVLFLIIAIGSTMVEKETLFKALDGTKREVAFLVGMIILATMQTRDYILTPEFMKKYR